MTNNRRSRDKLPGKESSRPAKSKPKAHIIQDKPPPGPGISEEEMAALREEFEAQLDAYIKEWMASLDAAMSRPAKKVRMSCRSGKKCKDQG